VFVYGLMPPCDNQTNNLEANLLCPFRTGFIARSEFKKK